MIDLLRELVAIPSVSPLEGGDPAATMAAQTVFAEAAKSLGYDVLLHESPPDDILADPVVPVVARDIDLSAQPSVVVGLGQNTENRIVINFHMDTVGPFFPPCLDDDVLHARGAVDAKGPGAAALFGVAAAFAEEPWLHEAIQVLLASVPGEEGGAMGVYGTRWLVRLGHLGRLMIFAEPTGMLAMDTSTATMTLRVGIDGEDSTDDFPADGHNATVGLGFIAARLAAGLTPARGTRVTIAGLHTGTAHNRVYGSGYLLANIAYGDADGGQVMRDRTEAVLVAAGAEFTRQFRANPAGARLAADWDRVVTAEWLKSGLPVLVNRDAEMESLLAAAGFARHDPSVHGPPFTCDAIWAGREGLRAAGAPEVLDGQRYVVACGPGRLDANGAHTEREHVRLADLDSYRSKVRDLTVRFGRREGRRCAIA